MTWRRRPTRGSAVRLPCWVQGESLIQSQQATLISEAGRELYREPLPVVEARARTAAGLDTGSLHHREAEDALSPGPGCFTPGRARVQRSGYRCSRTTPAGPRCRRASRPPQESGNTGGDTSSHNKMNASTRTERSHKVWTKEESKNSHSAISTVQTRSRQNPNTQTYV